MTPETSYGHEVVSFARDVLGEPLDPWQEWAAIHAGELLPDGRPRFRVYLILAARQNGKTLLGRALVGYWMAVEAQALTLITSTDRKYAKRTWSAMCRLFKENPYLAPLLPQRAVRLTLGEESLRTVDDAELIFAANNGQAARSTTLRRWLCDELREHSDWATWAAATNAMNAVPDAQTVVLTNQCDASGVVLDSLRAGALGYLETGEGDYRLGIAEWSAPDGRPPDDVEGLRSANPNLGRRVDLDALRGAALRAKAAGGQELSDHRTEVLCQRVHLLDPAIDPARWEECGTDEPIDMAEHRRRVALCFDVSPDLQHATAVTATVLDGVVHIEAQQVWSGPACTKHLRAELPDLVQLVRPRTVGWFPGGPAASIAAELADTGRRRPWLPARTELAEITGDTCAACMSFAELVSTGDLRYVRDDALLNAQAATAQRLWQGDRWRFIRRGAGHADAMYAGAGAAQLARVMKPPPAPLRVVTG